MRDSEILVTHHKELMELSHNISFIEMPRPRKLAALMELCTRLLGIKRGSVWLFPPERDRISCEWLHDTEQPGRNSCVSPHGAEFNLFRSDHPEYFQAITEERVIAVEDARNDIRTRSFDRDYLSVQNIHSMLDAPIFDGEQLSGVVCLESDVRRDWSVPDISLAVAIADTISLMNTHEAWLRSKRALEYVSRYDSLTGLANIDSLRDRLGHLVRKIKQRGTGSLALLWIDVDRLKTINDGLGPQAGDQVIADIGQRLKEIQLAGKDFLARIGGDEFALVIRNYTLPGFLDEVTRELVPELPKLVKEICNNQDMPVSALQFEVTEDSIQGDFSVIGRVLEQLVEAGAELAIDDFGTGYSSLSRLKSLPFSRIKIDRSFINNLPDDENDCAITLSIIGLARGLGLSVVAEGVESEAHEAWLFEKGCDYLQGYRYSKPLPYSEFISRYFSG